MGDFSESCTGPCNFEKEDSGNLCKKDPIKGI